MVIHNKEDYIPLESLHGWQCRVLPRTQYPCDAYCRKEIQVWQKNSVRGLPDGFIGSKVKALHWNFPNSGPQDLVHNTHAEARANDKEAGTGQKFQCSHADNIAILILTDKLGNYPEVRERALGICNSHHAMHAEMEKSKSRSS